MDELEALLTRSDPRSEDVRVQAALERMTRALAHRPVRPRRRRAILVSVTLVGALGLGTGAAFAQPLLARLMPGQIAAFQFTLTVEGGSGAVCDAQVVARPETERALFDPEVFAEFERYVTAYDWSRVEPDISLIEDVPQLLDGGSTYDSLLVWSAFIRWTNEAKQHDGLGDLEESVDLSWQTNCPLP